MCCQGVISAEIKVGEEQVGTCYCTKRQKAGNGQFYLLGSWNRRTDWEPLPPTRCFLIPLFGFFIPPLADIVRFSILTHFVDETSWVGNGNPYANRPLCVIMVFWGYLFKILFVKSYPKPGCRDTGAMSQCVAVIISLIPNKPSSVTWEQHRNGALSSCGSQRTSNCVTKIVSAISDLFSSPAEKVVPF